MEFLEVMRHAGRMCKGDYCDNECPLYYGACPIDWEDPQGPSESAMENFKLFVMRWAAENPEDTQ